MAQLTFLILSIYIYFSGKQISKGFSLPLKNNWNGHIGWVETYK